MNEVIFYWYIWYDQNTDLIQSFLTRSVWEEERATIFSHGLSRLALFSKRASLPFSSQFLGATKLPSYTQHKIPQQWSRSVQLFVFHSFSFFLSHRRSSFHGFMVACNNGMECRVSEYISNTDNLLNQNAYYRLFIFSLYLVQVLVSFINEYNEVVGALEK